MKIRFIATILTALISSQPVQAQNVDHLTPAQQRQLLTLLLKQQAGSFPQTQIAVQQSPVLGVPLQRSEANLASEFRLLRNLTEGVQFERFRDGFAINGRRYIDPEGKITAYGFDAQSGDFTYFAETNPGQFILKAGRALSPNDPITIGNAQKNGAQWNVSTVTGKKFTGYRLIPSSRGFIIARENTGFRYVPGSGTTNIIAPESFSIAALQNGDISNTGYILLERTPTSNGTQQGNSFGALFSSVQALGSLVGIGKKEDYALLNVDSNLLVPINVSLDDKQIQVMSDCKQRNYVYARCAHMDSFESLFQANGMKNMTHYFWRITWFNVPGRPILVSQESGLSKISATDLNSGKKVILFDRAMGIAGFSAKQEMNGKISVTAQMGLSNESKNDVVALLDILPLIAEESTIKAQ